MHRFDEQGTGPRYVIDTPPPTVSGLAPRRARLQLHADRRRRALPAHARQERLLPDGLGRQRPADRAARAELLPRALRAARAVRAGPRARRWPTTRRESSRRAASRARTSSSCASRSRAEDEKAVQGALAAARPLGRLARTSTRRSTTCSRRLAQCELPRPLREGRTSTASRRRRCGTSTSRPRSRRPRSRTARSRAPSTTSSSGSRAAGSFMIATTRPELLPACVGVTAHPERRALPGALRQARRHAALPRAGADLPERAGRPARRAPAS